MSDTHNAPRYAYSTSCLIMLISYIVSLVAVYFSFTGLEHMDTNLLIQTLILDIIFTTVIFIFCTLSRSSSIYDPMWGFAPLPLVFFWTFMSPYYRSAKNIITIIVVGLYVARHMFIYFRAWTGLQYEDFRYLDLKRDLEKTKILSHLLLYISYYVIPSLMVFVGMIPVYYITQATEIENGAFYVGIVICVLSVLLAHVSDQQLHNWRAENRGNSNAIIDVGLWRYSRHPNYLGEIMMWWGLYIMCVGTNAYTDKAKAWSWVGAMIIFLLFEFGTITMMEKHLLAKRPAYALQQKRVNRLFLWFRNQNVGDEAIVRNENAAF